MNVACEMRACGSLVTPPHRARAIAMVRAALVGAGDWCGLGLFAVVVLSFWLLLSTFVPATGNWFLDWLREDQYYCLLVPLTVPVTLVASYFTWLFNMLFQRN